MLAVTGRSHDRGLDSEMKTIGLFLDGPRYKLTVKPLVGAWTDTLFGADEEIADQGAKLGFEVKVLEKQEPFRHGEGESDFYWVETEKSWFVGLKVHGLRARRLACALVEWRWQLKIREQADAQAKWDRVRADAAEYLAERQ